MANSPNMRLIRYLSANFAQNTSGDSKVGNEYQNIGKQNHQQQ